MANVNAILANATIQVFDTITSTVRVNSPLGNLVLPASNSTYYSDFPVNTNSQVLTLVNTTIWACLVRSWATNSVNISLGIQPTGGLNSTFILAPGGVFAYWQTQEPSGTGLQQVSLQTSSGSGVVEILLAW